MTEWKLQKIKILNWKICAESPMIEYENKIPDKKKSQQNIGLVSLFNGISTLFRLFNAKAILL